MSNSIIKKGIGILLDGAKNPTIIAITGLAFWGFASRILGAFRVILVGQMPPIDADLFNASFVLTDNIIAILVVGSITLALLPHIIELEDTDQKTLQSSTKLHNESIYLTYTSIFLFLAIGGVSLLAIIFTDPLLRYSNQTLYTNLSQLNRWGEYVLLSRVLLFAPLLFTIKTILGSFLNAKKSYGIYALDGVITNIGLIIGLTVLYRFYGSIGAVVGVLIGFGLSAIAFGYEAWTKGLRLRLGTYPKLRTHLIQTLYLYIPRLAIIPALRIAETMITLTATSANGEITALRTALDIQGIPLSLITVSSIVFLPDISKIYVANGYGKEFKSLLHKYIKFGIIVSVVGFFLATIGTPILFFVLQLLGLIPNESVFGNQELIVLISYCTSITSFSLIFQTLNELYSRVYVALKNSSIPLISSLVGSVVSVVSIYFLLPIFSPAIATSISFSVNSFLQATVAMIMFKSAINSLDKKQHTN